MLTPQNAAEVSESLIMSYAKTLGLSTPEDVQRALEMLISKAARGIERYCSTEAAVATLHRTLANMDSQQHRNLH